jgi:hypothetical protein
MYSMDVEGRKGGGDVLLTADFGTVGTSPEEMRRWRGEEPSPKEKGDERHRRRPQALLGRPEEEDPDAHVPRSGEANHQC